MKIATKFIGSSVIVIVAITFCLGSGIGATRRAEQSIARSRERTGQSLSAMLDLHIALEEQIFALKDFVMLDHAPEDLVRYEQARSKFLITLDELELLLPASKDIELLRRRQTNLRQLTNGLTTQTLSLPERQQDVRSINSFSQDITFSLSLLANYVRTLEQQTQEAADRVKRNVIIFQLSLMGILLIVVALQFRLIFLPVIRSIRELQNGARKLGTGELNYRFDIQTQDELEQLANTFNHMATQLNQSYQVLEKKVAERTAELQTTNQDLTKTLHQLQQAQIHLIQSEKMSSLGQMVAGIAHEINNPINFVYGNLNPAQQYIEDLLNLIEQYQQQYPDADETIQTMINEIELEFLKEDVKKLMNSMQIGAIRIRDIVKSLRTFSRLDEAEIKDVDIHEGLDSTLMILQNRLKSKSDSAKIEVMKDYGELPLVECYPGQLNQVFMNLLTNAIDACEESPKDSSQSNRIEICTRMHENSLIQIKIKDNGSGIDSKNQAKLFDPFFTTKPIGKGTGLGLSISYQIVVDRHRGQLYCDSWLEEGTEFTIEIPCKQVSEVDASASQGNLILNIH